MKKEKGIRCKMGRAYTLKNIRQSGMADHTAGMSAYEDNLSELNANQAFNAQKNVLTESKTNHCGERGELASTKTPLQKNEASRFSEAEIAENEKKLNDAQS